MNSVVSSYFGEAQAAFYEICCKKVDEAGIASRCEFHEGYLDSLPRTEPFDAATSILVSQFLTGPNQRRDFFHQISRRLRPGGDK
jgi:tRNA (cmo5U34)-methyltransferase